MNKDELNYNTWNKVALSYEEKFMHHNIYNESYDYFCKAIDMANPSILEIGCGPGNITQYLLHKRPDFNILGTDISPNMIDLAKKNNPTASFKVMDSMSMNELHNRFDGIISGFCLPYLSELDTAKQIKDAYHLLNDQGVFYISFIEGSPTLSHFKTGSTGDQCFVYYHDTATIQQLLIHYSFNDLTIFNIAYPRSENETETHTIIVGIKKS